MTDNDNRRPDAIYWRRTRLGDPNTEICELENLWFWPGEGICVDGYFYWTSKTKKFAIRLPLEIWRQYGRRKRAPDKEHTEHKAIPLTAFDVERNHTNTRKP